MQQKSDSSLSILNLLQPEYTLNPYLLYHQLREHDPVYWDQRFQSWVVTRHADVIAVLRDPRFTAKRAFQDAFWESEDFLAAFGQPVRVLNRQMLFLDHPDHTRLRSLVSGAFTPRVVENMRASIQHEVDTLLDDIMPKGGMEVIADLAYPLASTVIATLLGIPPEDHAKFVKWSDDYGALIDGNKSQIEHVICLLQSFSEFTNYFRKFVDQHKSDPQDDLMQAMINAEEQGGRLNEDELLGNFALLIAAGHITTAHLIGNGLLALLQNPEQFYQLKQNSDLISSAVMEFLRYDSPTQSTERIPIVDLEIAGKHIKKGQSVLLGLGAANHDPAQFPDPDHLDLSRTDNRHVAFGYGAHFCLGSPLARLEAELAFNTLLQRLIQPHIQLEKYEYTPSIAFHNLKYLHITFT
ncbi:cytochrome P450 [Dictyobacter formicarum]|uniref:Biotin biosynthesis cytochrome P450 n=1 Tax=Dictyobacter formicarum TaxID=2778368 RepID=A0ABQ3VTZ9_9CHLR|nr:cytochrome P450 [Dictyobacter formicarum]GHO88863.1 biotin biosynthesis cytochrome P450 [Dictyobacter formicarum]